VKITGYLHLLNTFVLVGCNLWTRKENTAADHGVFYAITSESECMSECLMSTSCVAFDLSPIGCTLHNNADDLARADYTPGVTQFVLNRHCLLTSPLSTESQYITATSIKTTTGIQSTYFYVLLSHYTCVRNPTQRKSHPYFSRSGFG